MSMYIKYDKSKYLLSLKIFRKHHGYSIDDFAKRLNITKSYYSRLENGERPFSDERKIQLAKSFGFEYNNDENKINDIYAKLNNILEKLISYSTFNSAEAINEISINDVAMSEIYLDYFLVETFTKEADKKNLEYAVSLINPHVQDLKDDSQLIYNILAVVLQSLTLITNSPELDITKQNYIHITPYAVNYLLSTYHLYRYEIDLARKYVNKTLDIVISENMHPNRILKTKLIDISIKIFENKQNLESEFEELIKRAVVDDIEPNQAIIIKNNYLVYLFKNEKYDQYITKYEKYGGDISSVPYKKDVIFRLGLSRYKLNDNDNVIKTIRKLRETDSDNEYSNEIMLLEKLSNDHDVNRALERYIKKNFRTRTIVNIVECYYTVYNIFSHNNEIIQKINKLFVDANNYYDTNAPLEKFLVVNDKIVK